MHAQDFVERVIPAALVHTNYVERSRKLQLSFKNELMARFVLPRFGMRLGDLRIRRGHV